MSQHPGSAGAWYELARTNFYLVRLDEAQRAIEKAIALDPGQHTLLLDLGRQAAMQKDSTTAVDAFRRFLDLDPKPPVPLLACTHCYLARMEKTKGNDEKAEELLAKAKALDAHVWTTFMPPPAILFEK